MPAKMPAEVARFETVTRIFQNRSALGQAAGVYAEQLLVDLLAEKENVQVVFAAAPSQDEKLDYLAKSTQVDWQRVTAYHMDEYIGLPAGSEQSFGSYLRRQIFERVAFRDVHYLDGNAEAKSECQRYAALLAEAPIDVVLMGVGENGHIAFNDPPVANFDDPLAVKVVELDQACRQQQVNDGCFAAIDDVPKHALTLTIPTLMSASHLVCTVPGSTKAEAVKNMFFGPLTTFCPASALRKHPSCHCFFDVESAVGLL